MHNDNSQRPFPVFKIFFLYFLPVFIFSIYSLDLLPNQTRWMPLAIGLAISSFGSAFLFFYASRWKNEVLGSVRETILPQKVGNEAVQIDELHDTQQVRGYVEEIEIKQGEYLADIQQKESELLKSYEENQQLVAQLAELRPQLESYRQQLQESLSTKEIGESEYFKTIAEQRDVIEKQEQHIMKLEDQMRDLNYEIKTLLQINENHQPSPDYSDGEEESNNSQLFFRQENSHHNATSLFQSKHTVPPVIEANLQLKRCIDIAQKITVSSPFSSEISRFRDMPVNSYSLDLRRLFDSLRSENSNTIILYSQKEEKLLFANNQTKNLLGWSPEKFIQDFKELVVDGLNDWSNALNLLSSKSEVQVQLTMKSKSGQDLPVQCHMGAIPTGMFKNHLIGVLYQAETK